MIPPFVSPSPRWPARGFTMIEILATIAIIGVLAAMLVPMVSKMRSAAKKTQCLSNLQEIGTGLAHYAGDNGGVLPQGGTWDKDIAPYFNLPVDGNGIPTAPSKVFQCPMDPKPQGPRQRTYAASRMQAKPEEDDSNRGVFGRSDSQRSRSLASIPYPGVTIMICEKFDANNRQFGGAFVQVDGWVGAIPTKLPNGTFLHETGQNYLFCDGHAEFLPNSQVSVGPAYVPGWRGGRWSVGPQ